MAANPQPVAREVARAREWLRANPLDAWAGTEARRVEAFARSGAARYADGMRRAADIVAALNVGIATTPEGEAWNGAIRKAVAAIRGEIVEHDG